MVRGSNPGGGEIFRTCPNQPWDPPSLLYNGYQVFPGGKERPGRDTDPSPPSSAVGHERVEPYLYSPYGLYGLYRASVPVQGCTLTFMSFTLLMKLTTHPCLAPMLRMCGVILPFPIYTFTACIGTTLPLFCSTLTLKYFTMKCHIQWATLETSRVKPNLISSTDGL
jgi:hypothetical protein